MADANSREKEESLLPLQTTSSMKNEEWERHEDETISSLEKSNSERKYTRQIKRKSRANITLEY